MRQEEYVDLSLRWGDVDQYGHVNNVQYFRLLEEARARFLPTAGPGSTLLTRGFVVAHQEMDYVRSLTYTTAPIRVTLLIETVGNSSFTISSEVREVEPKGRPALCAKGLVVLVAFDKITQQSRQLSEEEKAWLSNPA